MKPGESVWRKNREEFLFYVKARRMVKTLKDYNLKLNKAGEFFREKYGYLPDPRTVGEREAAEFLLWMKLRGWDQNYYRRIFRVFAQFLAYSMNPRAFRIKIMTPRELKKPVLYYSLDDVRRARKAGIENFNVKKFRATMAKLLREIGQIELDRVSAQLGHSRTETTEEFYHRMGPTGLERGYRKVASRLLGGDGK